MSGRTHAQAEEEQRLVDSEYVMQPDDLSAAPLPVAFTPVSTRPLGPADQPPTSPLTGYGVSRTSVAFSTDWRAPRSEYRAIVEREAQAFGLPPALLDAVMAVESGYNPAAIGRDGEIGLMQVLVPTARMLGFTGTAEQLAVPEVNIHYGASYLAGAWHLASEDLCTATMKYRAGHGETRFSFLSVQYCTLVRSHLAGQGVSVTGSIPQPTFGRPDGLHARGLAMVRSAGIDLAAINRRLRESAYRKTLRYLP